MKKRNMIFLLAVVLFLCSSIAYASDVNFVNPKRGETKTWVYQSENTIPVNLQYGKTVNQHIYYVKMTDHNGVEHRSNSNEGIPQWWNLEPGTYKWKLELYEFYFPPGQYYKTATDTITFYVKHTIKVRNNFDVGNSDIIVDGLTKNSGAEAYKFKSDILSVGAINQEHSGNTYVWKINGNKSNWGRKPMNGSYAHFSYTKNSNYSVVSNDNGATIKGNLRVHTLPTIPTISLGGSWGSNPILSFSGGGPDVDYYVLKKEYSVNGGGFNRVLSVNPASNPYTDPEIVRNRFGGDAVARYSVKVVDLYGYESNYSSTVSTTGDSMWKQNGEETETETIKTYALNTNYPNPFNPSTQISYQIPKNSFVNLVVYNALGQEVALLVNQHQSSGKYSIQFDANNLPSGVYVYKLQAGEFSSVKKMLLMK